MGGGGRSRPEVPQPGRIARLLMSRRLTMTQRDQLMSELAELYEHRVATEGAVGAKRWIRREYRLWVLRLLRPGRGVEATLNVSDTMEPTHWGAGLGRDLLHSVRGLARAPLVSAAIVLTVGLGIGGTSLVYAVVHSVLITPLPYPGSDRMVLIRTVRGADMWGTSMADLDALYEPPPAFDAMTAYTRRTSSVQFGDSPELLRTKWVTDNYFATMGITPVLGRDFTADEGRPGGDDVVLVTERFSARAFGGVGEAVGKSVLVDGSPYAVVGVLPDDMGSLDTEDVYPVLPVVTPGRQGPFFFTIVGRLAPDTEEAVALEQLDAVAQRMYPVWAESFPFPDASLSFVDLKEILVGNVTRTLLAVLTAVGFLLLIASANAASLLVARGISRQREVSIRAALGATGGKLFQLLLSEAALLAGGGAVLGFGITWLGVDLVGRLGVGRLPRVQDIAVTPSVLSFLVAVTLASWALFGLVASVGVIRRRVEGLATSTVRSTASPRMRRLRKVLVSAQFAISVPLLVGAGLLTTSLDRLQSESFGFDTDNFVSLSISLPSGTYPDEDAVHGFWEEVLPRVEALPEVAAAGLANARPPVQYPESNNFLLEDRPLGPDDQITQAPWITASPGYFAALGVRTVEGTLFNDPRADTMRTALVDEAWAERYYPGQSALGRRFNSGACTIEGCPFVEVVGVVSNVKTTGLDDRALGTIYFDFRRDGRSSMSLHLRTRGAPLDAIPGVRRIIQDRDPSVPIAQIQTPEDLAAESLAGRRYTSTLVAMLAGIALLLSVVGIYGAMSYFVRQHARDIGIRLALGGGPASALRMVVGQGMVVALGGVTLGVGASMLLTRYIASLLYQVTVTDPLVYVTVCAGTLLVALGATAIPGRQAAAMDPATTLREE